MFKLYFENLVDHYPGHNSLVYLKILPSFSAFVYEAANDRLEVYVWAYVASGEDCYNLDECSSLRSYYEAKLEIKEGFAAHAR